MKNESRIMILVAVAALVVGCAPAKYVPTSNEELFGTWVNPSLTNQKIVLDASSFSEYSTPASEKPNTHGTMQIVRKWTDSEGNIWYQTYEVSDDYWGIKNAPHQTLHKLSKSATVWEHVGLWVDHHDPRFFPDKLDQSIASKASNPMTGYRVYYRQKQP